MTAIVQSSPAVLPSRIYLDTGVVVAAIMRGALYHEPARDFCVTLANASSHVYFSSLLQVEFLQALVAIGNDPTQVPGGIRRRYRLHRWGESDAIRLTWLNHALELFEGFLGQFSEVDEVAIAPRIVTAAVPVMARHMLRSYDALHVSTAAEIGLSHFATCDSDFLRVEREGWLTVHLIRDG
ncbi:MAG: type II toxin-antitoxin system VapC family toxin [Vicinamibacterales bacterium]